MFFSRLPHTPQVGRKRRLGRMADVEAWTTDSIGAEDWKFEVTPVEEEK